MPYLPQAQPALALLLLAWYCGFTTICRRNGNCADPNQTDSYTAGWSQFALFFQMICQKTLGLYGRCSYLDSSHQEQ